jgi:hypothetical protein
VRRRPWGIAGGANRWDGKPIDWTKEMMLAQVTELYRTEQLVGPQRDVLKLRYTDGSLGFRFRHVEFLHINASGSYWINDGGFPTMAMKDRVNLFIPYGRISGWGDSPWWYKSGNGSGALEYRINGKAYFTAKGQPLWGAVGDNNSTVTKTGRRGESLAACVSDLSLTLIACEAAPPFTTCYDDAADSFLCSPKGSARELVDLLRLRLAPDRDSRYSPRALRDVRPTPLPYKLVLQAAARLGVPERKVVASRLTGNHQAAFAIVFEYLKLTLADMITAEYIEKAKESAEEG